MVHGKAKIGSMKDVNVKEMTYKPTCSICGHVSNNHVEHSHHKAQHI